MSDCIGRSFPHAYIIRRGTNTVTVECPFCGEEHEHNSPGLAMAICERGEYIVIARL